MSNVIEFKKLPSGAYDMTKEAYLTIALMGLSHLVGHNDADKADWLLQHCPWLTYSRLEQLCCAVSAETKAHYDGIKTEYLEKASPILVECGFEGRFDSVGGLALACFLSHDQQHYLVTAIRAGIVTDSELVWIIGFLWRVYQDESTEPEEFIRFAGFHAYIGYWGLFFHVPKETAYCEWCSGYGICTDPDRTHPDWTDGEEF